jgi:two-component system OmpR family response regulator
MCTRYNKNMRALIVDDQEDLRETISRHLRSECFAVDTASTGTEGSYLARTNDYDILILDNLLPGKNGQQVCEEIRETGCTVPILMLSVLGDAKEKAALINSGADDYMNKPFSLDELMARVRALMRRPQKIEPEILTLGDLTIERGNKHIYLTRKEFMLLEYLLRNIGSVMSRGMIMEHVWDMSSDPFSNTIESHVLSLRKKIGDTAENRIIKTVPGRGYIIEA